MPGLQQAFIPRRIIYNRVCLGTRVAFCVKICDFDEVVVIHNYSHLQTRYANVAITDGAYTCSRINFISILSRMYIKDLAVSLPNNIVFEFLYCL